jgi:hypothetical protein
MRECDTYKQQLPIVYMSSNNVTHLIAGTITTLHFTCNKITLFFMNLQISLLSHTNIEGTPLIHVTWEAVQ